MSLMVFLDLESSLTALMHKTKSSGRCARTKVTGLRSHMPGCHSFSWTTRRLTRRSGIAHWVTINTL